MERAFPGYLGFGVYLVIYLLSPTHLRASLFYEIRTYPGYLDFGFYWVIYLLSWALLRAFLFYVELAASGYLDFGVYIIINLFFFSSVYVSSSWPLLRGNYIPRVFGGGVYLQGNHPNPTSPILIIFWYVVVLMKIRDTYFFFCADIHF